MELKRFSLGIRFDLLAEPLTPQVQREIWQEIFSVLTLSDVKNLHLYAGPSAHTVSGEENVYLCVLSNGKLRQMRRVFRKLNNDAGIGVRLATRHPFIQNNRLLQEQNVTFLGAVLRDATLAGGQGLPGNVRIPKKHGKKRPEGKGIKVMLIPEAMGEDISSHEVVKHFTAAARKNFMGVKVRPVPITEGGRGTVNAVLLATNGVYRETQLAGPNRQKQPCGYAVLNGKKAVITLASTLLSGDGEVAASSDPAGQLLRRLLDEGLEEIIIAPQDYRTADFGVGLARALGVRFYNEQGEELKTFSSAISGIDAEYLHPGVHRTKIYVMQKNSSCIGISSEDAAEQDSGFLKNLDHIISLLPPVEGGLGEGERLGAGGLGPVLALLLKARFEPAVDLLLKAVNIKKLLRGVSLVVSSVPVLSLTCFERGLLLHRLIGECSKKNIPIAIAGGVEDPYFELPLEWKNVAVMPIPGLTSATLTNRRQAIAQAADRMFQFIRAGVQMPKGTLKKSYAATIGRRRGNTSWSE